MMIHDWSLNFFRFFPSHVNQVLQGLRAGASDLKALQGKAQVEEGQSIGEYHLFGSCMLVCGGYIQLWEWG